MKIAIVGSEEIHWIKWQREKAKNQIRFIFREHATYKDIELKLDAHSSVGHINRQWNFNNLILISGGCPRGGVDIWAEEVADELGIKKEIYKPEVNRWANKIERRYETYWIDHHGHNLERRREISRKTLRGYQSRNIQIAKACDVLYDIEPFRDTPLGYRRSGGTWTMEYAKKLGKETHLVVIS